MAAQIKHLFVLMMENRSFDHMLGFLRSAEYAIEGLTGSESNEDSAEKEITVSATARYSGDLTADPNHHFADVTEQLYGVDVPAAGQAPNMSGFVKNYQTVTGNVGRSANIMKCFAPEKLPVLTTLARDYAVCDHWFSSIPGPTLPNRLYAHCGTSRGRLDMAPEYIQGFYTVYEELAKHGVRSTIFYQDWSGTLSFAGLLRHQNLFFDDFSNFAARCRQPEEEMPAYCFIEPRYNPEDDQNGGVYAANDQHPDNDVGAGESLILNVYHAIRSNDALWRTSMLVIVYDEHGGLYDHVSPLAMVSPDGLSSMEPAFDFTLSGVRVPAVVVSPYIKAGTISKTVFDHTSLIATAMALFVPSKWPSDVLFDRAEKANTLLPLLDLGMEAREDLPAFGQIAASNNVLTTVRAAAAPLSDLQRESVEHADSVNRTLPAALRVSRTEILQSLDASAYVKTVAKAAVGNARARTQ
jgi:phospholipase C